MGAITRLNINNLFWLGRYVERVFTTLNSFFKYADRFIEADRRLMRNISLISTFPISTKARRCFLTGMFLI